MRVFAVSYATPSALNGGPGLRCFSSTEKAAELAEEEIVNVQSRQQVLRMS